jgi:coenzyme F420-reducing hydrogenase delta subunit
MGISQERLRIEYCSSVEGVRFAEIIKEMTKKISQLGPNPIIKAQSFVE